jgi:hypothetical protein
MQNLFISTTDRPAPIRKREKSSYADFVFHIFRGDDRSFSDKRMTIQCRLDLAKLDAIFPSVSPFGPAAAVHVTSVGELSHNVPVRYILPLTDRPKNDSLVRSGRFQYSASPMRR